MMDEALQQSLAKAIARAMLQWAWELPDDVSDAIEEADVLRVLATSEWVPLLNLQVEQMAIEREQAQRAKSREWDIFQWITCSRCERIIHIEDCLKLGQATGRIHLHDEYTFYCPTCATKVREEYTATCWECGRSFIGWDEGLHVCLSCLSKDRSHEPHRLKTQLSRARSAGCSATLTIKEWLETVDYFGGICAWCQEQPNECMEHIIPINAGGGTTVDNCVPSCWRCNTSKGSGKHPRLPKGAERREELLAYLSQRLTIDKSA